MADKEITTTEAIYKLLAERMLVNSEEDMYIQYPNSVAEMQVQARSPQVRG